jgi:hypothetical protein
MKKKYYLTLDGDFIEYCKLNKIDDVEKYAKEIFNREFTKLKYGDTPNIKQIDKEKTIEKWEKSGLLDLMKPGYQSTTTFESNLPQVVPEMLIKKKDIYDE